MEGSGQPGWVLDKQWACIVRLTFSQVRRSVYQLCGLPLVSLTLRERPVLRVTWIVTLSS